MTQESKAKNAMTIGTLSRRCGLPVRQLRHYEEMGLIYTVGRSEGNYRLFGEESLWCVNAIRILRGLGLTLVEIQALAEVHLKRTDSDAYARFAELLRAARTRTENRITELCETLGRIDEFESAHSAELFGRIDLALKDS